MTCGAPSYVIGVDIGGTTTRAGSIDHTGKLIDRRHIATDHLNAPVELTKWIRDFIHSLQDRDDSKAPAPWPVGIAVPGLLDERRDRVRRCVNVPWLEGESVSTFAARALEWPVRLFTDTEAATWGEYAAREFPPNRFAHLRIGTGVGLGVIQNRKLIDLTKDRTTHLEELVIDSSDGAIRCRCGLRGCLEAVLPRMAGIDEAASCIVLALERLSHRWSWESIVLGGGAVQSTPNLFEHVQSAWALRKSADSHAHHTLKPALLGDDAGIIGAARLTVPLDE